MHISRKQFTSGKDIEQIEEPLKYMEPDLRLTIIDWQGEVLFDNLLEGEEMENHLQRPEIQKP